MRKKWNKRKINVTLNEYRVFKNIINAKKIENLERKIAKVILTDYEDGVIYENEISANLLKRYVVDSVLDDDDVKSIISSMLNFADIARNVKNEIILKRMYDEKDDVELWL